jgi:anti-sigma regulatory factor (Ser/Thr protein kinase)
VTIALLSVDRWLEREAMKSRTSNLRPKIIFLLVSLTALWSFAAFVTVREGLNLLWINTLDQEVGRPTDALITLLQEERRLSAITLAAGSPAAGLDDARQHTDAAAGRFRETTQDAIAQVAATDLAQQRIAALRAALDRIGAVRADLDAGRLDRRAVVGYFTTTINFGYQIYESISVFDDREIDDQLTHLLSISRGRELLSQEDALMSGVLTRGVFTADDAAEFSQIVGAQRYLRSIGIAGLPEDQAIFGPVLDGAALTGLRAVEDRVIAQARPGGPPPVTAAAWRAAFDPALTALADLDIRLAEATINRATGPAIGVIVRLVLAAGLGLIAVIASIIVSVTTARAIITQLRRLRDAADDLALVRLPRVVQRLQAGEEVDVAAEAPPLAFGDDEIGQVSQAFNAAQQTAVQTAVEQAALRRSVRDLFLSLARRSQTLLYRQLALLDTMERRATDPADLEELFRIDHLATRMRRNAENLIVLSGATPGRAWRRTVPIVDVIQAAVAEVEDYTRVRVRPSDPAGLTGPAVGDVVHLLAELIENAITFSPRQTNVEVYGAMVGNGYLIEILDRGLGMSDEDLNHANEQLSRPPELTLTSTVRLGHFVVGRLAERHHIQVSLCRAAYGGTAAVVVIPEQLISQTWTVPTQPAAMPATTAATSAAGSPAMAPAMTAPAAVRSPAPAPATSVPYQRPAGTHRLTPSGLPVRAPRAARTERGDDQATTSQAAKPQAADQQAEHSRRLMTAYQLGSRRARFDLPEEPHGTTDHDD